VANDRSVQVGANNTRSVTGDDKLNVTGSRFVDVRGNVSENVGGTTQETLAGDVQRTLGAKLVASTTGTTQQSFADDYTERHLGHRTVVVGSDKARRSAVLHIEGRGRAYASKSFEVEALESFTLICGDTQILVGPKGITLSSPNISLVGKSVDATATTFRVAASASLTLAGQTATMQTAGAQVALDATTATVKASKVQLGNGSGKSLQTPADKTIITRVLMNDSAGKPRANARVLLTKDSEQRMTVLDSEGRLELIGDASYTVSFPDDPAPKG
jgi:hypothetical protein